MSFPVLGVRSNMPPQNGNLPERSYFLDLPTEVIQHIAALLPSDKDLCSLIGTCRTFAGILIPSSSGIWRKRFLASYDPPHGRTSEEIKLEYQIRSLVLSKSVNFRSGEGPKQKIWLEIVKTMLIESLMRPDTSGTRSAPTSKNLKRLTKILSGSEFMNRPVFGYGQGYFGRPTDSFAAVQLCLTHIAIDPEMQYLSLRTDYDISVVYKYGLPDSQLFRPGWVCLESFLHIRNFWKRHLTSPDEDTFYYPFWILYRACQPMARPPQPIENCMRWLGFISRIHPFPESLTALEEHQASSDIGTHVKVADILSLNLITRDDNPSWPELFNSVLPIHDTVSEAGPTFFRGQQSLANADRFEGFVVGFTEELPEQGGLPGWCRICLMICEINKDSSSSTADLGQNLPTEEWLLSVGISFARGYEGIIIPGGKIMLGRWCSIPDFEEVSCDGPFIFWQM